mmetsp:Transcript_173925/g.557483  ORF Transcript_173925/g.557483 Transcript_173925/m.557483 type:complete len:250 (+) Transcript_173925:1275-2024(+)
MEATQLHEHGHAAAEHVLGAQRAAAAELAAGRPLDAGFPGGGGGEEVQEGQKEKCREAHAAGRGRGGDCRGGTRWRRAGGSLSRRLRHGRSGGAGGGRRLQGAAEPDTRGYAVSDAVAAVSADPSRGAGRRPSATRALGRVAGPAPGGGRRRRLVVVVLLIGARGGLRDGASSGGAGGRVGDAVGHAPRRLGSAAVLRSRRRRRRLLLIARATAGADVGAARRSCRVAAPRRLCGALRREVRGGVGDHR